MDILQVAKQINAELIQLQSQYSSLFDEQSQIVDIFNSIVTCIMDDLADIITLSISNRSNVQQVLVRWQYDLRDKQYAKRNGPKLSEILALLKQVPPHAVGLFCTPEWSRRFSKMDSLTQKRALQYTIWAKHFNVVDDVPALTQKSVAESALAIQVVDVQPLEFDLLKLASETKILDQPKIDHIGDSVTRSLGAGHIQGVRLLIIGDDREPPLLRWEFKLTPDHKLERHGENLQQILLIVKGIKRHPHLKVEPITTSSYDELSPAEQQEAMKNTIWDTKLEKR